jgi:NADPH-dependent glutamate synthase beta subunit-like oxidoreductase
MSEAAIGPVKLPWEGESGEKIDPDLLAGIADDILDRCRGEGPANCVARCPLRVDARGYVQLTKEGRYREALQLVRERLPFPGILGYICAHPCELHCKRIDEDSAVRIRDVKRFLAEWEPGEPQHILDREAEREESIAIVGAGPAGLIAAHDLKRRGYRVTIFEKESEIGGCLTYKLPAWRLPREILKRDLSIIDALDIEVRTGTSVGADVMLEDLRRDHDAVLLLVGYEGGLSLLREQHGPALRRTVRDTPWSDPVTCETGIEGLFAGGDAVSGPATVIQALEMGRRAAESAHRWLNRTDLREGRESPLPRRLLWTLEIDESERQRRERTPVMLKPFNAPLTEEEARSEGERCLDCECGLCVKDCEFLKKHCRSPKELARSVKDGFGDEEAMKMVYSCNICSLCKTVCPEELDTGAMLLEARRRAVEQERGPLPQHKPIVSYFNAGISKTFSLIMPEPGRSRSKRLFFTGCALPAVAPQHTLTVYEELRKNYPGTGVMMYCCGAPVELLGMDDPFEQARKDILRMAESVGADELIPACPDCAHTLTENVPELKITTVWEMLAEHWQPPREREGVAVSIHDSCKARHMPGTQKAVRAILEKSGGEVRDVEYVGELARCCGFGGMIYPVDAELSQAISRRRGDESPHPMITYCAGCRMALAGCGKEAVHILDFLFSPDLKKSLTGKPPGSIPRYFNRFRTKLRFKRLRPRGSQ